MPTEVLIADDLEPIRQLLQQSAERGAENSEAISRLERTQAENAEQIARNAEAISRIELLTEQNARAIGRLEQSIGSLEQAVSRLEGVVAQNSGDISELRGAISALAQFVERSVIEAAADREIIKESVTALAGIRTEGE